jgi:hypothetical protein
VLSTKAGDMFLSSKSKCLRRAAQKDLRDSEMFLYCEIVGKSQLHHHHPWGQENRRSIQIKISSIAIAEAESMLALGPSLAL